ncbi:uncharacterized protein LOC142670124 [Rhinoderma darwinii]|uniref:uncharacterized protein LOC142670124 n=1 Tax=Rhinoderma darwinii TaxID=43563 RepID=UPI003F66EC34
MPRGMDVERLILFIQEHPAIWDNRCEEYHNRTVKEDAWELVAKNLFGQEWETGRTRDRTRLVQDIKTRWRSCRDQFRREMGDKGRSGDGASRKRPYIYTKQLMFLKDIMDMRTITDNLEDTAEETDVGESVAEAPAPNILPPSPEPTPQEPAPGQSERPVGSPAQERPVRARSRRLRAPQPSTSAQVDTRVLEYLRRAAEEDGNDAFGRSIVPLLRLVPMDLMGRLQASIVTLIDACRPPHNPHPCFTAIEQWRNTYMPPPTAQVPGQFHPVPHMARPHPYMRPMAPHFAGPTFQPSHQHHYAGQEQPTQLQVQHSGAEMQAYASPAQLYQHL